MSRRRSSNFQFASFINVFLIGRQLRQSDVVGSDNLLHELLMRGRGSAILRLEIIDTSFDLLQNKSVLRSKHHRNRRGNDAHRVAGVASGSVFSLAGYFSRFRSDSDCVVFRVLRCHILLRWYLHRRRVILDNRLSALPFVLRLCQIASAQKKCAEKKQRERKNQTLHCSTDGRETTTPSL